MINTENTKSLILQIDEDNKIATLEEHETAGYKHVIEKYKITHYKPVKPSVVYMRGIELYNGAECVAKLEVNEFYEFSVREGFY